MAQYLALIYDTEAAWQEEGAAERGMVLHNEFGATYRDSLVGGEALENAASATTIRSDGAGGYTVTDGPYAETKEVLGGYYVIEAPDLDAALEIAKHVPVLAGSIEVRPIMVFDR